MIPPHRDRIKTFRSSELDGAMMIPPSGFHTVILPC